MKMILVRGEFIIPILDRYRPLSKVYDELLKKAPKDDLIKKMISTEFMNYTGAYHRESDQPSYMELEQWLNDIVTEDVKPSVIELLEEISKDIQDRLNEEIIDIIGDREYLESILEVDSFESGVFLIMLE